MRAVINLNSKNIEESLQRKFKNCANTALEKLIPISLNPMERIALMMGAGVNVDMQLFDNDLHIIAPDDLKFMKTPTGWEVQQFKS